MLQGQKQQNTNDILEAGTYTCKLGRVFVYRGKPDQFSPEGKAKVLFIWQVLDEDGAVILNEHDRPYEVAQVANLPKNLAFDTRGNFYKTLGEISDITINNENVDMVTMDLGAAVQSYEDILELIDEPDPDKQGKKMKLDFASLKVGQLELVGLVADLNIKPRKDDAGKEIGNDIKSITLKKPAAKKTPLGKKAAPAAKAPEAEVAAEASEAQEEY